MLHVENGVLAVERCLCQCFFPLSYEFGRAEGEGKRQSLIEGREEAPNVIMQLII